MGYFETADERLVSESIQDLLLDSERPTAAFYASCALHLNPVSTRRVERMVTDGTALWYNPEWFRSLTPDQRKAVVAHEVTHCVLRHPYRRGDRELDLYNVACDHVTNLILTTEGYDLPGNPYRDGRFINQSVEAVYATLDAERQQKTPSVDQPEPDEEHEPDENGTGDESSDSGSDSDNPGDETDQDGDDSTGTGDDPGDGDGNGPSSEPLPGCDTGSFVDPDQTKQAADEHGDQGPPPMTESDWQNTVEQIALTARLAGSMGSGADRALKAARQPQVDCWSYLKDRLRSAVPTGRTWAKSNRRFTSSGLYLPGKRRDTVGPIIVAIDTSGSVSQEMLDSAGVHLTAINHELQPESVTVLQCDAAIQGEPMVFGPEDDIVLGKLKGGGGTLFKPIFDYISANDLEPLGIIVITDTYNYDLEELPPPDCNVVIWAYPIWVNSPKAQPFGELLAIDIDH